MYFSVLVSQLVPNWWCCLLQDVIHSPLGTLRAVVGKYGVKRVWLQKRNLWGEDSLLEGHLGDPRMGWDP